MPEVVEGHNLGGLGGEEGLPAGGEDDVAGVQVVRLRGVEQGGGEGQVVTVERN